MLASHTPAHEGKQARLSRLEERPGSLNINQNQEEDEAAISGRPMGMRLSWIRGAERVGPFGMKMKDL